MREEFKKMLDERGIKCEVINTMCNRLRDNKTIYKITFCKEGKNKLSFIEDEDLVKLYHVLGAIKFYRED